MARVKHGHGAGRAGTAKAGHLSGRKADPLQSIVAPCINDTNKLLTKVVATLGPGCSDVDTLARMLRAGMRVARLDLTWGPLPFHAKVLDALQAAMRQERTMCAVMVDTLGRKVLVRRPHSHEDDLWPRHEDPIEFSRDSEVLVTARPEAQASSSCLPVSAATFPALVQPGDAIYVGRYLATGLGGASGASSDLWLAVESKTDTDVVCRAMNDASISGLAMLVVCRGGATAGSSPRQMYGSSLCRTAALPLLTEYDRHMLKVLGESYAIHFVGLSSVLSGAEVAEARAELAALGLGEARLCAKLESQAALHNFEGLLEAADAITISRGYLGLDVPPEKVALVQKAVISAANLVGKPVMVTRMMDSMVTSPRPTRAEATDVANAVLDGADALQLGAETLRGRFPVESVAMLAGIAQQAEAVFDHVEHFDHLMQGALRASRRQRTQARSAGASPLMSASTSMDSLDARAAGGGGGPADAWDGGAGDAGARRSRLAVATSNSDLPAAAAGLPDTALGARTGGGLSAAEARRRSSREQGGSYADIQTSIRNMVRFSDDVSDLEGGAGSADTSRMASPRPQGLASAAGLKSALHRSLPLAVDEEGSSSHTGWDSPGGGSDDDVDEDEARSRGPHLPKIEAMASSAVRVAEKVDAALIVVVTHTMTAPALLAKYRPPVPILVLVVPRLASNGVAWRVEGAEVAAQCLLTRGLMPMLAAPGPTGSAALDRAVSAACHMGIAAPGRHVVVVERLAATFGVKVVQVGADCTCTKAPTAAGLAAVRAHVAATGQAQALAAAAVDGSLRAQAGPGPQLDLVLQGLGLTGDEVAEAFGGALARTASSIVSPLSPIIGRLSSMLPMAAEALAEGVVALSGPSGVMRANSMQPAWAHPLPGHPLLATSSMPEAPLLAALGGAGLRGARSISESGGGGGNAGHQGKEPAGEAAAQQAA